MAGEITTTSLQYTYETRFLGAIQEAHDNLVVFPRITSDVVGPGALSGFYNLLPTLSVSNITEGTGMSNTSYAPTSVSITPAQRGIKVTLLDIATKASVLGQNGILQNVFRQVVQDVDSKICALFTGFRGGPTGVGAWQETAATMTYGLVFSAMGKILASTQNMGMGQEMTLVLHPTQWTSLQSNLVANGQALVGTPIMGAVAGGNLATIFGVPIAVTGQVADGGTGQKAGALFTRDALGCVVQWYPTVKTLDHPDAGGGPGTIATVTYCAGFSELADGRGCSIVSD